jgi:hypothetical protein
MRIMQRFMPEIRPMRTEYWLFALLMAAVVGWVVFVLYALPWILSMIE